MEYDDLTFLWFSSKIMLWSWHRAWIIPNLVDILNLINLYNLQKHNAKPEKISKHNYEYIMVPLKGGGEISEIDQ